MASGADVVDRPPNVFPRRPMMRAVRDFRVGDVTSDEPGIDGNLSTVDGL